MIKLQLGMHFRNFFKRHPHARDFIRGFAQAFDPLPFPQPCYRKQFGTDEELIRHDMEVVGKDMWAAIRKFKKPQKPHS